MRKRPVEKHKTAGFRKYFVNLEGNTYKAFKIES
jgi:hypothetical protein